MPLMTIMFTDVVASSATKRDPSYGRDDIERDKAYIELVQQPHFALVREVCSAYDGHEVNTMGDAFFLTFADPVSAVRCAIEIQRRLAGASIATPRGPLHLRIGMHTGQPQRFEGGWHGTDVDIAARVEATATASQVLLSSSTYELVRNMTDVTFHRVGEFMLKGIERAALWEADWDGRGPRPTSRLALSPDLDVPPVMTSIVGRRSELLELASLVEQNACVCIEGLSGIGKTTLVLALAHSFIETGRIQHNGFFYFDCSQRNMRISSSADSLMRSLSSLLAQGGNGDAAAILADERQPLHRRVNVLVSALAAGSFLLFLDNFQDAIDVEGRMSAAEVNELFRLILSRPIGNSRVVCASYLQWRSATPLNVRHFTLKALTRSDARELLTNLGVDDALCDRAAELVGRHPQAMRWFTALPRQMGLSTAELINDLTNYVDTSITGTELHWRIEHELLERIWRTLPEGASNFLSRATVFRRPVPFEAFCAVTPSNDLQIWRQAFLDRFLLEATSRGGPHTIHALVHEFGQRRLGPGSSAWRDAHAAAARWWQGMIKSVDATPADTLKSHIEVHYHLVSAGEVEEADVLAVTLRPILRSAGLKSLRRGMPEEAEAINRALVQTSPDNPKAHYYLAYTMLLRGKRRATDAGYHLVRALDLSPTFYAARILYGTSLGYLARDHDAETQFRLAVELDSEDGNARAYAAYAAFLAERQRFSEAEENYTKAITAAPRESRIRLQYARFLQKQQRIADCQEQFEVGIQLSDSAALYAGYAGLLAKLGATSEAKEQFEVAISRAPQDRRTRIAYAGFLTAQGSYTEAQAQFERALIDSPDNATARKKYAQFVSKYRPAAEAEATLKSSIEKSPGDVRFRKIYAQFLAKERRFVEAEEQFKTVISMQPHNVTVRFHYADFLAARLRFADAEAQFQAAFAIKSTRRLAKEYERFKEWRNRHEALARNRER